MRMESKMTSSWTLRGKLISTRSATSQASWLTGQQWFLELFYYFISASGSISITCMNNNKMNVLSLMTCFWTDTCVLSRVLSCQGKQKLGLTLLFYWSTKSQVMIQSTKFIRCKKYELIMWLTDIERTGLAVTCPFLIARVKDPKSLQC